MSRLERLDAYLREFESVVEDAREDDAGLWWRLRESAFYATGGGQPHDSGTLTLLGSIEAGDGAAAAWAVEDVEADDEGVWHRVTPPAGTGGSPPTPSQHVGTRVHGHIDWERRFHHMQRHTAQHLVSQAFVRLDPEYGTRAVSLSSPDVTLDLAGEPGDEAVSAAFELVNRVAAGALPIEAFEVDEGELSAHPLRRPAKVTGRVRLVRMGDWELSACGGTHLRSSAEAMPILALARERIRRGLVRVTFRAGLEAVAHANATQASAAEAARALSSSLQDLPGRVNALLEEASSARRALSHARAALARTRAEALAPGPAGVVAVQLSAEEGDLATDLADALAERGVSAVVGAQQGDKAFLVLASGAGADVRPALKAGLELIAGRGGGKPERAQGAGPDPAALAAAIAAAENVLKGD